MRKMVLIFAFFTFSLFGDNLLWMKHNFSAATMKAQKVHKPLLLMFSSKD